MTEQAQEVSLHEHRGRVALRIGAGITAYISTTLAAKLAAELKLAAEQVHYGNHYEGTTIEESN